MPWSETNVSKERVRFVLEWERRWRRGEGEVNVSELCREFGVSRECGYKWLRRYRDGGCQLAALEERSRRPRNSPTATSEGVQDLIAAARKHQPKWGPVKLRSWLAGRRPDIELPSASAIAAILKRRGLVRVTKQRRRRGPVAGVTPPFGECDAPNRVWCIDFKGWFLTLDGHKCYPLTITDQYSRFVLRCEALADPDGAAVFRILDSAFREFGLPDAIRSDGGPPFASTGPAGLTTLSVWWLQLGIKVQRIAPGKPQQNGRHERMHRTLALEVEPQANLRAQQRAFDYWRRQFNEERPHAALGNRPPACIYQPSSRRYPRPLIHPEPGAWNRSEKVDHRGYIRFDRRKIFIGSAIAFLRVALETVGETVYAVYWGTILLGRIDTRDPDRRIRPTRRRRDAVSVMSLV
jgi:putative transposase